MRSPSNVPPTAVATAAAAAVFLCGTLGVANAFFIQPLPHGAPRSISRLARPSLWASDVDGDGGVPPSMGPNEIQTLLRRAIDTEDYAVAARLRDALALHRPAAPERPLSWEGLGTVPWLSDRLADLGLGVPTTAQCHSFEAVGALIRENEEAQEALIKRPPNMGIIVTGEPGSGKTLAYMAPLLTALSESLGARQKMRGKRVEDLEDEVDDWLARMKVVSSPSLVGGDRTQAGRSDLVGREGVVDAEVTAGGEKEGAVAAPNLGRSGTDTRSPLAIVVVPSRELGVQTALEIYKFVGGNTRRELGKPGDRTNSLRYKGPRGVRIAGILTDQELEDRRLLPIDVDLLVVTPEYLNELVAAGDIDHSVARAVVVDEADVTLGSIADDAVEKIWTKAGQRTFSFVTFLVGASVTAELAAHAADRNILPPNSSYVATEVTYERVPAAAAPTTDSLRLRLDPGLVHRALLAPADTAMLRLTRMLQAELLAHDADPPAGGGRPRVVVFFPDEATAARALTLMRDALWGEHKVCALLPNTGKTPVDIMEQFRYGATSVMCATPSSVRGLDFPGVTHVYTLFLPMDSTEYLHLAGRVGRIGQAGSGAGNGGIVTSILEQEKLDEFRDMATNLGFQYTEVDYEGTYAPTAVYGADDVSAGGGLDDVRKYLEDLALLTGGDSNIAPLYPEFVDTEEEHEGDPDETDGASVQ